MGNKKAVHETEQTTEDTKQIDMGIITAFNSNSNRSVIVMKLFTSSSQNCAIVPYKIDTGSDGNLMPHTILNFIS